MRGHETGKVRKGDVRKGNDRWDIKRGKEGGLP